MITKKEASKIAEEWATNYAVDPDKLLAREMDAWYRLDDLIVTDPKSALLVFEEFASLDVSDWVAEGFGCGPVRNFLYTHPSKYNDDIRKVSSINPLMSDVIRMAEEGL